MTVGDLLINTRERVMVGDMLDHMLTEDAHVYGKRWMLETVDVMTIKTRLVGMDYKHSLLPVPVMLVIIRTEDLKRIRKAKP